MTYLTQIKLDYNTVLQKHVRDCYDWHQLAWTCFEELVPRNPDKGRFAKGTSPQDQVRPPADFLIRVDQRRGVFRLLIVSPVEPRCPEWCAAEAWQSKPIPDSYFTRRVYVFQLRANPTKKITKLDKDGSPTKNGRREPLRKRDELVAWIKRKGAQGGFTVDEKSLRTFSRGREYFEKKHMRGLHSAVEFQGLLTVNDPQIFHHSFRRGIGPAKAFGFGLLVIAPIA